jgi:heme-degrading monooxygenase HmoA
MHALHIHATLKPGKKEEFLKTFNAQILPLLKKQNGFVDEILLFEEHSDTGFGLSFWKSRKDAEQYQHNVFEQARSRVEHLIQGKVTIRNCEVEASETFHISGSHKAA